MPNPEKDLLEKGKYMARFKLGWTDTTPTCRLDLDSLGTCKMLQDVTYCSVVWYNNAVYKALHVESKNLCWLCGFEVQAKETEIFSCSSFVA